MIYVLNEEGRSATFKIVNLSESPREYETLLFDIVKSIYSKNKSMRDRMITIYKENLKTLKKDKEYANIPIVVSNDDVDPSCINTDGTLNADKLRSFVRRVLCSKGFENYGVDHYSKMSSNNKWFFLCRHSFNDDEAIKRGSTTISFYCMMDETKKKGLFESVQFI